LARFPPTTGCGQRIVHHEQEENKEDKKMKVFEINLSDKKGVAFDFDKFDVPNIKDALDYMLGYIGGAAWADDIRQNPSEEIKLLFPDFGKGWDHGGRVLKGEKKPVWHSGEIELHVLFVKCGAMPLDILKTILHDRAVESKRHVCGQHEIRLTSTEQLKA
jgi:hypothetical protein